MFGAESLAVPVKYGQEMTVRVHENPNLEWTAMEEEKKWFSARIALPGLTISDTTDHGIAMYLVKVLKAALTLNPGFLSSGAEVTTRLNYPREWGLGSSSTFISNIARWADVNAMQLHSLVSEGSGYDVACATSGTPILFRLGNQGASWKETAIHPSVVQNLFLVYLGKKQDTQLSIRKFRSEYRFRTSDIACVSEFTQKFVRASSVKEVIEVINEHEAFISKLLSQYTVKQEYFKDFEGSMKSLGAWGGDYALAASLKGIDEVKSYFHSKGYATVFRFDEMAV
jgi:mevalonate kinase